MIIFHTADLHLDSSLQTRLSVDKAEKFNANLTQTFQIICENAIKENAEVIIIAGDLFDDKNVNANLLTRVQKIVEKYINILFIYVYGNHDFDERKNIFKDFTENFIMLKSGESLVKENVKFYCYSTDIPVFNENSYNVVIGHGTTVDYKTFDEDKISLPLVKNRNVDYLALGHYHDFKLSHLDVRGYYAYSGCPAGRGFDECGQKGYVKIDTVTRAVKFEPLENPLFIVKNFDLSNYNSTLELEDDMKSKLSYPTNSLVRAVIKGKIKKEEQTDFSYINNYFENKFFYFELRNETEIDYDELINKGDFSLKSEFLKVVKSHGDEFEKEIIEKGLKLLK